MSVGTFASDVGFHLCRSAAVCSCDILLLLGFGLYLVFWLCSSAFAASSASKSDAALDYSIYVVASEHGINGGKVLHP